MGISRVPAELLLFEHRYRPIRGELLTVSRNTIGLTAEAARELVRQAGVPLRPDARVEADRATVHTYGAAELIADYSFYALFSDARLSVLDVSDYEGADILHDMSLPIDPALENRFDFIINGSCLDNIFNPVTALQNVARMLKPGGRLFQFEWTNSHPTAYLKFSPDWFLDYFAVNRFADCKAYLLHYADLAEDFFNDPKGEPDVDLYAYEPLVVAGGQTGYQCSHINSFRPCMTLLIAEKAADSTWDKSPIQTHYRFDPWHRETCLASAARFRASPRPLFSRPAGAGPVLGSGSLSRFGTLRPVASWRDLIPAAAGAPERQDGPPHGLRGPRAGTFARPAGTDGGRMVRTDRDTR